MTAVEIVRSGRNPVVVPLLRVLFGLGVVISSYHARPGATSLAERLVLQRRDGRALDVALIAQAKAAIMPVVHEEPFG